MNTRLSKVLQTVVSTDHILFYHLVGLRLYSTIKGQGSISKPLYRSALFTSSDKEGATSKRRVGSVPEVGCTGLTSKYLEPRTEHAGNYIFPVPGGNIEFTERISVY